MGVAGQVIDAVKTGKLEHVFLIVSHAWENASLALFQRDHCERVTMMGVCGKWGVLILCAPACSLACFPAP